jgi:hypothetical protein
MKLSLPLQDLTKIKMPRSKFVLKLLWRNNKEFNEKTRKFYSTLRFSR